MRARTIAAAALAVLLALPLAARADELQAAVTKLLDHRATGLVLVKFDVKRADGSGGREVTLPGTFVDANSILVSGANTVDPSPGTGDLKPESFEVLFPDDVKAKARLVGKDPEHNLALLRLDEGEEVPEGLVPVAFDGEAEFRPAQPLIFLRRLDKNQDDLVSWDTTRISIVVPKPGQPDEYRVTGSLRGFEGCPVYGLDCRPIGYITAAVRNRNFRVVNGQLIRMPSDGVAGPTRILHSSVILEFLADPTRGSRRDCWLGVSGLQAVTKELAEAMGLEGPGGLLVGKVLERSPAEQAGFRPGDVIVGMGDETLDVEKDRDIASFQRKVRRAEAGSKAAFRVLRAKDGDRAEVTVEATLEEAPLSETEVADYHDEAFGLKLKPLTRDFLESSRLPLDSKGVRVTWVEPAGWASIAGIRPGDVIQKMVLKPCPDLETYKEIMAELMKTRDSEVCYNVSRNRKSLFLCVRPDWTSVPEVEGEETK